MKGPWFTVSLFIEGLQEWKGSEAGHSSTTHLPSLSTVITRGGGPFFATKPAERGAALVGFKGNPPHSTQNVPKQEFWKGKS